MRVTDAITYIGVNDHQVDLFEGQYKVPNGMSYNSYLIMDEQTAVMDTVDIHFTEQWFANMDKALNGRQPDYLIVQHMEPDHSANIQNFAERYPQATIVANAQIFGMIENYFDIDLSGRKKVVDNGETLKLGRHELTFVFAPMVHWPEVMVSYESTEKVLFSADGFGKFGALSLTEDDDWACEARRYYFNIVGKYGNPVQALLKKAATLDIATICPLHGPILKENLGYYIGLYDTWSKYEPENTGVLIAYASIHGNTAKAAEKLGEMLRAKGVEKVVVSDLAREDMAEVIEDAFRYDRMVLCGASYDGGVFPCMQDFLHHLQSKAYQKRTVGMLENGSWAPCAAKAMREIVDTLKDVTVVEPVVTIRSTMKDADLEAMEALAEVIAKA